MLDWKINRNVPLKFIFTLSVWFLKHQICLLPSRASGRTGGKGEKAHPDPSRGGEGGVLKELFHLENEGEGRWSSCVISPRSTEN